MPLENLRYGVWDVRISEWVYHYAIVQSLVCNNCKIIVSIRILVLFKQKAFNDVPTSSLWIQSCTLSISIYPSIDFMA